MIDALGAPAFFDLIDVPPDVILGRLVGMAPVGLIRIHSSLVLNLNERTYLWPIALLRIYVGYYFLAQGYRKWESSFAGGDWIARRVGDLPALDLYPWYKRLLLDYVAPHQEFFGYLVTIGELAVGACLLIGFFTRLSAVLGLFLLANYYLGLGMARGGITLAHQEIFFVALAVLALSGSGRALGLDGLLTGGRGRGLR